MKLEKWKDRKDHFTKTTSEINRQLVFAGIAVIWIFTKVDNNTILLPNGWYWALGLFILSLGIDILQYLYLSTTWTIFFRCKESKQMEKIEAASTEEEKESIRNEDIKAPKILPNISHLMFYLKIACNMTAYGILLYFVNSMIIW